MSKNIIFSLTISFLILLHFLEYYCQTPYYDNFGCLSTLWETLITEYNVVHVLSDYYFSDMTWV